MINLSTAGVLVKLQLSNIYLRFMHDIHITQDEVKYTTHLCSLICWQTCCSFVLNKLVHVACAVIK